MKKDVILYGVFAIVLGAVLFAFGIYLIRQDLMQMLVDSLKELQILGLIFAMILYIPVLLIQIFFWCCLLYAVFYVAAGIFALVSFSKGNLIYLQKTINVFFLINSLILFIVVMVDFLIMIWFLNGFSSDVSPLFIVFISLTTALAVAFEVITVMTRKKLKQTPIDGGLDSRNEN